MASITRAEVASLIQEEYGPEVIKTSTKASTVLSSFPTVNMGTKVTHMPVLASLPEADWVTDTDNTAVKPTSKVTWADRTLVAEEIAVIVPIHEDTIDDATADILQSIAELAGQAIGKRLDQAVLFGEGKPTSWTSQSLYQAAISAGQAFTVGAGVDDLYGSLIQAGKALAALQFTPSAVVASAGLRFDLANLRGSDGHLILSDSGLSGFSRTSYNENGAWDSVATALVLDPSCVRVGVRQDITVKYLTEATITGVGNLAELDMVAFRFKARFAYVLGLVGGATPVAAVLPGSGVVPPSLTSIIPVGEAAGGTVYVNGHGLASTTGVVIGNAPATFDVLSDSQLEVGIPALADPGSYPVVVTNPAGSAVLFYDVVE